VYEESIKFSKRTQSEKKERENRRKKKKTTLTVVPRSGGKRVGIG